VHTWLVSLDHGARPTPRLQEILLNPALILVERFWESTPAFVGRAEARRMLRRDAAGLLGREVLNRRPTGRLIRRYGGQVTPLFLDLAAALRHVECHRLRVGGLAETADRIEELVSDR
jgi:hypothetical protein